MSQDHLYPIKSFEHRKKYICSLQPMLEPLQVREESDMGELQKISISLKGKTDPVVVRVLRV